MRCFFGHSANLLDASLLLCEKSDPRGLSRALGVFFVNARNSTYLPAYSWLYGNTATYLRNNNEGYPTLRGVGRRMNGWSGPRAVASLCLYPFYMDCVSTFNILYGKMLD